MRLMAMGALAALAMVGIMARAEPQEGPPGYFNRALFITPMGEPFRADTGAHGIDLWFAAADADHDEKISHAEYLAEAMNFFAALDSNKDDSATSAESSALWQAQAPEMLGRVDMSPPNASAPPTTGGAQHHDRARHSGDVYREGGTLVTRREARRGMPVEPPRQGAGRYGLLNIAEPVMTCDADFSRRVTRQEFETCADRRFAQIDVNGDGFFTRDEAAAQNEAPTR